MDTMFEHVHDREVASSSSSYRQAMISLPTRRLERTDLLRREFLIGREGALSVYYAPLDAIERRAVIVFVGLTPGWEQMRLAFEACRDALLDGQPDHRASAAAKASASFSGMRQRITFWLDDLGVASWLGLDTTAALFEERSDLLHTTSAIRYPVFVGEDHRNYTGQHPRPSRSDLLMKIVKTRLVPELGKLPEALIVPMGTVVGDFVGSLERVDPSRCLFGFPHPSGANGHARQQYAERRKELRQKVRALR